LGIRQAINAITWQVGQVIDVQNDLPQWGLYGGRVAGGNTNHVSLDQSIIIAPLASGETTHKIRIIHNDDTYEEAVLTDIPGTYPAGTMLAVADCIHVGDTDTSATWHKTPVAYEGYSIGIDSEVCKPFRCMGMQRANNGEVDISLEEYQAASYDTSGVLVEATQYSYLPDPRSLPPEVDDLKANASVGYEQVINISWSIPEFLLGKAPLDHVDIYVSLDNGDTFSLFGSTKNQFYQIANTIPNKLYTIRVVSVSVFRISTLLADAPEVAVLATVPRPPDVKGLQLENQSNVYEFFTPSPTFTWKESSWTAKRFEAFGNETVGAGVGSRDAHFQQYRVEIWTPTGPGNAFRQVRVEYIQEPRYTYTIEKNREDHINTMTGAPSRTVSIAVLIQDIYGQFSQHYTSLEVTNDEPGLVKNPVVDSQPSIGGWKYAIVSWDELENKPQDFAGYIVCVGTGVDRSTILWIGGSNNGIEVRCPNPNTDSWHCYIAAYDAFEDPLLDPIKYLNWLDAGVL
jgi:hypothetical protein